MMKRLSLYLLIAILCFAMIPKIEGDAKSTTIASLRQDLNALEAEYKKNESLKSQTKTEKKQTEQNINNSKKEIDENNRKIDEAKVAIEALNVEIAKTEEDIIEILRINQVTQGDNVYLEYVFNSGSFAEMVYRYAIVKQVAAHTSNQVESYNDQIIQKEALQVELAAREKEIERLITQMQKDVIRLNGQINQFDENTLSIKEDIDSTRELIKALKDLGCGENQDMEKCIAEKGDIGFKKPLPYGVVTSYFGYRTNPVTGKVNSFHSGIDLGGNKEGTNVYAIANGVVGKVINASASNKRCGGRMVYVFHTIMGKKYTSAYLHLLEIKVKVGQQITSSTVVGTVGGGAKTSSWETCSTGAHLHLSLATGWYGATCSSGCYTTSASWTAHLINPKDPLKFPNKGTYWRSR